MIRQLTVAMMTALAILNGANAQTAQNMGYYPTTMAVVDVDYENDEVTAMDFNGYLWSWEGCEDWYEGDVASMMMCDNGTDDYIFDDIIISTKYSGWVDSWGYDIEAGEPLVTFEN